MVVSGGGVGWQWFYEGQPIPDATGNFFVTDSTGNYTVTTTDSHGCHYYSAPFYFSSLGVDALDEAALVNIFPNPANSDKVHLQVNQKLIGALCTVFDADGRTVFKMGIKNTDCEFELNIAPGIYVVQILSAQSEYTLKLIKL